MREDPTSRALEDLVARFGELIRGVGRRHDFGEADVQELVQDVRIRIWRALGEGERIAAAPASYVYQTAMSAAVDLIRRRRARREEALDAALERGGRAVTLSAAGTRPDEAAQEAEVLAALGRAIDALSDSRRPVVRMYLAGYGHAEIAQLLGWTEAKARNLLYRGLADLRAEMRRLGFAPGVVT